MNAIRFLTTTTALSLMLGLLGPVTLLAQQEPPPPAAAGEGEDAPSAPDAPGHDGEPELRRLDEPAPTAPTGGPEDRTEEVPEPPTAPEEGAGGDPVEAAEQARQEAEAAAEQAEKNVHHRHPSSHGGGIVRIGSDALLPAGETADAVVAIAGSVIADGEVREAAVAVMGDTTLNGRSRGAVAVMGNVTVNGRVDGEVVAVMGSVQLGPNAEVHGEVVSIGGNVTRAPGAVIHGPVQQVGPFPVVADGLHGLRTWFRECLMLGRPLGFHPELGWAWGVAAVFLGIYLLIALILHRPLVVCAETLERRPGMTLLVSLLAALLIPLVTVLLTFIGVGLVLAPVIFVVGLFGKAAFLAWMGRRILLPMKVSNVFLAVLLGGIILFLLYTIPFFGFLMMKVSGAIGLGMALYAGLLAARRPAAPALPGPDGAAAVPSPEAVTAPAPGESAPAMPVGGSTGVASVAAAPGASGAAPRQPPPPVPTGPIQFSTLPRAGFWIRLGASLIDLILVVIVLNFLNLEDAWPVFYGAYCVVLWALRATTIGGIICGLKVVRLDDRKVDWPIAFVRALGGFLSAAILGLGFIWVVFDPERQSWHDKIAGTTIVRVPKGVTLV